MTLTASGRTGLEHLGDVRALLLDADGNLFPSEEPAFVASAEVTTAFLAAHGVQVDLSPEQLRLTTTGKNFRSTAVDLALEHGVALQPSLAQRLGVGTGRTGRTGAGAELTADALEHWVREERRVVSAHLAEVLAPDADVVEALTALSRRYQLAVVSSSALDRLDACFRATGLAALLPPERRFSAEDSLPVPTSKPDPAVYTHAGHQLGLSPHEGVAVEDSVPGATSAVGAGFTTVGNLRFVQEPEREERLRLLEQAGVAAVTTSWREVADLLLPS